MINKTLDLIGKDDVAALVADEIGENRTLDYKEQLPGNTDADKSEFLEDVSSFANAAGGDILFGVREKRDNGKPTGIPEAALGLRGLNADAEVLRLENIIRDGIAPRIQVAKFKVIPGFPDGSALLLRIEKSWSPPHMITFKRRSPFYSRNNAGKYPLDVGEIRSAFALSESLPSRLRRFRDERLSKIIADETPIPLNQIAKIVLHLLPIAALDPMTRIEMSGFEQKLGNRRPLGANGWDFRYNFDGFLTFAMIGKTGKCGSYLQFFRNGAIEAVEARMLTDRGGKKIIPTTGFEVELVRGLQTYLNALKELDFTPPIFVMITLVNVRDFVLGVDTFRFVIAEEHQIDRDLLPLPDIMVEDYAAEIPRLIRPAFDAVWQAGGWDCSKNYDQSGNWVPK